MPDAAPHDLRATLRGMASQLGGRVVRGSLGLTIQTALTLASTLYVSRALGAEGYGLFGFAIFFSVQASQLLGWGMSPIVVRDLVRRPEEARRVLGACLVQRTLAAACVLVAGLGLALAWRGEGGWLLTWLGVVDGVLLGFTLPAAFDAKGRLATFVVIAHVRPLGHLAGSAALHLLAPSVFGPRSVLLVHAASLALSVALEWAWIVRTYGRPRIRGTGGRAAALWRESAPLGLGDFAGTLLSYAGIPAVAWLGHPEETGHLNLSNQMTVSLASLTVAANQALHAHLAARPDPWSRDLRRLALDLTAGLCGLAVIACLAITLVAPTLVPWAFGAEYTASGRLLQVDCWRLVGILGAAALASVLACQRRLLTLAACQAAGLGVSVGIALATVPRFGAMGAAAGSTIGRLVVLAALLAAVVGTRRPRRTGAEAC